MDLLRKKDVIEAVGVPKSTVSDWINEFHMFIPTAKQGSNTYYKPEAVEVLQAIKEMREKEYSKPQIGEQLAKRFPMDADETSKAVSHVVEGESDRSDAMIALMSTMSKAMEHIGRQDERIRDQDERLKNQEEELRKQQLALEEVMDILQETTDQLAVSRKNEIHLEAKVEKIEEKQKEKSFWQKLFGGKNDDE